MDIPLYFLPLYYIYFSLKIFYYYFKMSRIILNKTSVIYPRVNIVFSVKKHSEKLLFSYPLASGAWISKITPKYFTMTNHNKLYKNTFTNMDKYILNAEQIYLYSEDFQERLSFIIDTKRDIKIHTQFDSDSDTMTFLKLY